MNEVTGPHVVLEPRRLQGATVGAGARFGAEFPRFSQTNRPFEPQLAPEPPHPLDVHRPAAADQHRVDPAVAGPRVAPGHPLDLPGHGRLVVAGPSPVPQARARPPHPPASPPLPPPVPPPHGPPPP